MIASTLRNWLNRKMSSCGKASQETAKIIARPYIFLITSTIRPSENPLSYTHTRSVFSAEQRLEQTLRSIESVRAKVPDALVVLLENSDLSTKEVSVLQNVADWFVLLSQDAQAIELRDSFHKGAAEAYMLLSIQNVLMYFDYRIMFKLSGRYWLSERFDIHNFPSDRFGLLLRGGVYSTRLYSVPKALNVLYCRQLDKAMRETLKGAGIEVVIMQGVPSDKIMSLEYLGVQGYISPNGEFIDE